MFFDVLSHVISLFFVVVGAGIIESSDNSANDNVNPVNPSHEATNNKELIVMDILRVKVKFHFRVSVHNIFANCNCHCASSTKYTHTMI